METKKLTISIEDDENGKPRMKTESFGLSLIEIIGICEATRVNCIVQLNKKVESSKQKKS